MGMALASVDAGVQFLLLPGLLADVAQVTPAAGTPGLGAITPREAAQAVDPRSPVVKLSPARQLGPKYPKDPHRPSQRRIFYSLAAWMLPTPRRIWTPGVGRLLWHQRCSLRPWPQKWAAITAKAFALTGAFR